MSIPARAVLVSQDLQARARVLGAAERAGAQVAIVTHDDLPVALEGADLLILDLDEGREDVLQAVSAAPAAELPDVVVGFVSHVDGDLARAARAAGVRAIARGRFWARLPELLRDPATFDPSSRTGGTGDRSGGRPEP